MKTLLKAEEFVQFLACAVALFACNAPWWCYLLLLIGPDISMLGYLVNTQVGAFCYNLFHHKGIALVIAAMEVLASYWQMPTTGSSPAYVPYFLLTGLILFGHASMDRVFGYGLKFGDSFQHTHLGWIGKMKKETADPSQ